MQSLMLHVLWEDALTVLTMMLRAVRACLNGNAPAMYGVRVFYYDFALEALAPKHASQVSTSSYHCHRICS
jgi:hypothetical protein